MDIKYKVYKRDKSSLPIVSLEELASFHVGERKKYVGRNAKIEAIKRIKGTDLEESTPVKEINDYVTRTLYKTSEWNKYLEILEELHSEREQYKESQKYLYDVEITVKESVDRNDERLLYIISNLLVNKDIEEYKGLVNPIVSWKIKAPVHTGTIDKCFEHLINTRNWHKDAPYDKRTAWHDKKLFKEGKLSYERKKEYLEAAGYSIVRSELWQHSLETK